MFTGITKFLQIALIATSSLVIGQVASAQVKAGVRPASNYASLVRSMGQKSMNALVRVQPTDFAMGVKALPTGTQVIINSAILSTQSMLLQSPEEEVVKSTVGAIGEIVRAGGFPCEPNPGLEACAINPKANRELEAQIAAQGGFPEGSSLKEMIAVRSALASTLNTTSPKTQKSASRTMILDGITSGIEQGKSPLMAARESLKEVLAANSTARFQGKSLEAFAKEITSSCQ